MSDDAPQTPPTISQYELSIVQDPRSFVKLLQCPVCSRRLQNPVTLPCGNTLCRSCLPPSHVREHITYPATRPQAINCSFLDCVYEVHSSDNCSVDVVLGKLLAVIHDDIDRHGTLHQDMQVTLEVLPSQDVPTDSEKTALTDLEEKPHIHTIPGSRLLATYAIMNSGDLPYTSSIKYESATDSAQGYEVVDKEILSQIQELSQKELDCHICYNLMLDPVTTPCGHTFCRKCLARILDHSNLCPVCRRNLPLPSSLAEQSSNTRLVSFISALYPEQMLTRQETVDTEERSAPGGLDTALFVVCCLFPAMPMLLHVFEPRYRLMIRRALEGNGQFGMVAHNQHYTSQGSLGRIPFMHYGVMVQVEDYHQLADGRSVLQCRGVSRFKVLDHGMLDGYTIARVEKVEDIGLSEEERIEQEETSIPTSGAPEDPAHLDRMSTQQLMDIATDFIRRGRERSPQWLPPSITTVYGGPPTDPAIFPYWFASVLPLNEMEKYKLLPTTSVRERLKITARWVHKIDAQRW